ncbi:MAG: type II secretion system inner membrane protein GspF [Thermodesulfobacteriota bacterium]|nr:type II secretion system inner membrane protein GspF [Thermodesulfobacteriota bacterium]
MPVYEYKALDNKGKSKKGIIDADNPRVARLKLRAGGIFPIEISEEAQSNIPVSTREIRFSQVFHRIKTRDTTTMTRQLSTLIGAGLPLVNSLTALIDQVENPSLKKVIAQIREEVTKGSSLADAMAFHPRIFSSLYVNMVRAGEASGTLEDILSRLADFSEDQLRLRNRIMAALIYPILMVFIGSAIVTFLVIYVIPTVSEIFVEMEQALPLPTLILIGVSDFMRGFWWALLLFLFASLGGLYAFIKKTDRGRLLYDGLRLKVPLFGNLIRKSVVSRFSRTLGMLLKNGVPLLISLDVVKGIVNNRIIYNAIESVREDVREGENIAVPLRRTNVFPPLVIHMISAGENSGELEDMLFRVADSYDNEVETTISAMTSVLEPILILVMGVTVGFIVLATLLPILEMNQIIR